MDSNPYAAPRKPNEPSYGNADTTDLFVDTLATPQVRAAGMAAIVTGVATLFVCFQLVINTRGPVAMLLEALTAAIGVAHFGIAWGVTRGRAWMAICGMLLAVFSGLLLGATFLMTGGFSCLIAGTGALVTLVFLAVNLGTIRKMGRARAAMDRASRSRAHP
jgi:hypothetical protein